MESVPECVKPIKDKKRSLETFKIMPVNSCCFQFQFSVFNIIEGHAQLLVYQEYYDFEQDNYIFLQ